MPFEPATSRLERLKGGLSTFSPNEAPEALSRLRQRFLTDPLFSEHVSLHEAGHIIYGMRLGGNVFEVRAPETFNFGPGQVMVTGASIVPVTLMRRGNPEEKARYYAAGEVVSSISKLAFSDEVTGDHDFYQFVSEMRTRGMSDDAVGECWQKAINDIRYDLQKQQIEMNARIMAREVEKKILACLESSPPTDLMAESQS